MHSRLRNNGGFTLIEILVAIILFTFGALLAARMQTASMRSTTFGKEALTAVAAAQTLTEQLKEQATLGSFNTVLAGGGPGPVCTGMTINSVQAGTVTGTQTIPNMTIQWVAGAASGTTPTQYTTVQVTVQWPTNKSYTTSTIISQN